MAIPTTQKEKEEWFLAEITKTKKLLAASQTALELVKGNFDRTKVEEETLSKTNSNSNFLQGSEARVQEAQTRVVTAEKSVASNSELLQRLVDRDESLLPVETNPSSNQSVSLGEDAMNPNKRSFGKIALIVTVVLILIGMLCWIIPKITNGLSTPTSQPVSMSAVSHVAKDVPVVVSGVPASEMIAEEKLPHASLTGSGCIVVGDGICAAGKDSHNIHGKKEAKPEQCTKSVETTGSGNQYRNYRNGGGHKEKKTGESKTLTTPSPHSDVVIPQLEVQKFVESKRIHVLAHPSSDTRPLPCVFSDKPEKVSSLPKECSDVLSVLPEKDGESVEKWRSRAKREVYDKYIELVCAEENNKLYIPLCL